jgi:hypothetical protein
MTYAERLISEFGREIIQLNMHEEDIYKMMDLPYSNTYLQMLHVSLKLQWQINNLQQQIHEVEFGAGDFPAHVGK